MVLIHIGPLLFSTNLLHFYTWLTSYLLHDGFSSADRPWRWRLYLPPKRRLTYRPHGAMSQRKGPFITVVIYYLLHLQNYLLCLCYVGSILKFSSLTDFRFFKYPSWFNVVKFDELKRGRTTLRLLSSAGSKYHLLDWEGNSGPKLCVLVPSNRKFPSRVRYSNSS
jgi:hypothetical protein